MNVNRKEAGETEEVMLSYPGRNVKHVRRLCNLLVRIYISIDTLSIIIIFHIAQYII